MKIKNRKANKPDTNIELEELLDTIIDEEVEDEGFEKILELKISMYEYEISHYNIELRDYRVLTGIGLTLLAFILILNKRVPTDLNMFDVCSASLLIATLHKCFYDIMYVKTDIQCKQSMLRILKETKEKIEKEKHS